MIVVIAYQQGDVRSVSGAICFTCAVTAPQVGKSAFVRAMLRDMGKFDSANFDPAAMSNGRYLPVESAMPGTTLGIIPLQAFATGGTLYGMQHTSGP